MVVRVSLAPGVEVGVETYRAEVRERALEAEVS